jgi:DNA-directed RNA polymerase specialized sigma24 family protein
MPRRKQKTIKLADLQCRDALIEELRKNPLLADYDMDTVEIIIKENYHPHINKDIDELIDTLQRQYAANRHSLEAYEGTEIITNTELAKLMKVSRSTVNRRIKDGLIKLSARIHSLPLFIKLRCNRCSASIIVKTERLNYLSTV